MPPLVELPSGQPPPGPADSPPPAPAQGLNFLPLLHLWQGCGQPNPKPKLTKNLPKSFNGLK